MIEALVLDIGGVILRTSDRSGRYALDKKYGLPPGGTEELVFNSQAAQDSTLGMVATEAVWAHVAEVLSLSPDELENFKLNFWEADRVDQELLAFLESQQGMYITALLSNAWSNARLALAEQFGIIEGKTVDHILISAELGVAKPDQRIFRILADTIKCHYDQILFVDDFIENIQAANELGIQTIHYLPEMDLIAHIQSILEGQNHAMKDRT
jgi:glucose-1-phosphatase